MKGGGDAWEFHPAPIASAPRGGARGVVTTEDTEGTEENKREDRKRRDNPVDVEP